MFASLYTSRVVLEALGVEDFGIYNVVGGVVSVFTVISGALSSAISRFITYELGKGNNSQLNRIFSASVTIQLLLALIVVVGMETIGVWFLNTQMEIPAERLTAANWTLQLSIVTFVINLISVPYNATIIAHEKMSAFAYISILEVMGKLLIAFLIVASPIDRLVFYSILMCLIAVAIRFIYAAYCKRHFKECNYRFVYDKEMLKQMFFFASWNFLGTGAYMLNSQGVNILINLYFGVKMNAARAIVTQVDAALRQFINSFTTAVNPQIVKSYAQENFDYMYSLVCRSAKFSSFLLLLFVIPISFEAKAIFSLWLNEVPEYTVTFFRLSVFVVFVDGALTNSLMTSVFATGNIKQYQIAVSALGILVFPFTWLFYSLGYPAWITYVVYAVVYCGILWVRLRCVKKSIGMQIQKYVEEVLLRVLSVSVCSILPPLFVYYTMSGGIVRLVSITAVSFMTTILVILFIGLTKDEREFIIHKLKAAIHS